MKKIARYLLMFIYFFTLSQFISANCYAKYDANIDDDPRVLVLMSYNYDWESVPLQLKGIRETFNGYVDVDYVFMDTKNREYNAIKDTVYQQVLAYEVKEGSYDGIIAADDDALHFVMEYRQDLFENVPVVFEGINDEKFAQQASMKSNVTGIVETFPLEETIQMAMNVQPQAKYVVAISDDSISGLGSTKQFLDARAVFPHLAFSLINTSEMTSEEIRKQVAAYKDDTILIFLMLSKTKNRNGFSNNEAVEFITKNANIPVYKADELGMGHGILGGVVVSYEKMAAQAAKIMMALNEGADISSFPLQTANTYISVDKAKLDELSMKKSDMPDKTLFINDPPGFIEKNKNILIGFGTIIIFLLLFLITYIFLNNRRKDEYEKRIFIQSQLKIEKEANAAKTDFLARMSHDMRTPMNGILGILTLMKDELLPENVREELYKAEQSGRYLLNLINDTLDVGKIEKNQMELHPVKAYTDQILSRILSSASVLAKDKNIKLEVIRINPEKIESTVLFVDEARLEQLFMNLISNAIKYTPKGGNVTVTIQCLKTTDDVVYNRYQIIDDGIGMSKEFLEHLYEPFLQEGRMEINHENGTGLGMSIVRGIVDLMHANLEVKSELNIGTTFTLEVCLQKYKGDKGKTSYKEVSPTALQGKRILMCEDHPLNQMIAVKLLERKGMLVETADNGKIGLEMMTASPVCYYDAILMDIRMPIMDGFETTRYIRALDRQDASTIPIIAMTANAFDEDVRNCLEAGMNAHIGKPIDVELLYQKLTEWINK